MWPAEIQAFFQRNLSLSYSGLKEQASLSAFFMFFSVFAYSSIFKMEATCSSETTAVFQGATYRYILENKTLHNRCSENLKSYFISFFFLYLCICVL
jgi:hypothetical protein